jgi:glyoxylase-like metal-dependent hydrolase (beta-lactamase superfamily II)
MYNEINVQFSIKNVRYSIFSMSEKKFASVADAVAKKASFIKLAKGVYAYTTEGDPNSGVVIGDKYVMVIEAQATPVMAQDLIACIRSVTDLPIKYVFLSHYHAVRVMGASAYNASEIVCSTKTFEMIHERGEQDFASEVGRFPRLFRAVESIPSLTYPSITFSDKMTIDLGNKTVECMVLGEGHTRGDAVVWLADDKIMFSGDLVEYGATPYCGDAQLANWSGTLDNIAALQPQKLVPGRGEALDNAEQVAEALDQTRDFTTTLLNCAKQAHANNCDLAETYRQTYAALKPRFGDFVIFEHCLPFNVTRAFDEAQGITHPRIWTAERDTEMWHSLQAAL